MSLNLNKLRENSSKVLLASRLYQARGNKPQKKTAEILGLSQAVLSKIENGHREVSALELKKLADFYQKPLSFFFDKEPEPTETLPARTLWSDFFHYPVQVTPQLLETITQKIVDNFDPKKVILFGSHAWGKPRPESDIDLLVVTKALRHLRPAQRRRQVKNVCQPPLVPMDVLVYTPEEIHERTVVGDLFLAKILAEGKIIYDKPPRS